MDLDRVHINPVAPDPSATARYGSREERSPADRGERDDVEEAVDDRIEISETGRRTYREHIAPPDFDFARKALGRAALSSPEREIQLAERVASGYYTSPVIIELVVARLVGAS